MLALLLFLASPTDTAALLDRAGLYVVGYSESFRNVLAEEVYVQTLSVKGQVAPDVAPGPRGEGLAAGIQRSYDGGVLQSRTLRSDMVCVPLPGSIPWGSFRDTYEVDGKPLRNREVRLERLFSKPEPDRVRRAQALLHESARHNLGPAYRNYNLPLVALLFLLPQNQKRFEFRVRGKGRVESTPVIEVDYKETTLPTLLRNFENQVEEDLQVRGRFWIEPATGRVLRTEMEVRPHKASGTVRVEYSFVEKLGLLAPREMHDLFEEQSSTLKGTAEYRNYRRFEAEVGPITFDR